MFTSPNNKTALRFRRNPYDLENASESGTDDNIRITELEERNRELERKILSLQRQYGQYDGDGDGDDKYRSKSNSDTTMKAIMDRGGWLVGLLIVQSCSSFILAEYESLLHKHPTIVYFLTMLIGAGGNAGNQAAVGMIREIALGNFVPKLRNALLKKELIVSVALTGLVGLAGLMRAMLLSHATAWESVAITISLVIIVFISIVCGALLPFLLHMIGVDPAHSSTSIQVIMDILGVLLVCSVSSILLS